MKAQRTLRPITVDQFDAQFPPVPMPEALPISQNRRLITSGETYSLTRVVMPDGELRRRATQFNGYGDECRDLVPVENSMRFGCAWTPVEVTR